MSFLNYLNPLYWFGYIQVPEKIDEVKNIPLVEPGPDVDNANIESSDEDRKVVKKTLKIIVDHTADCAESCESTDNLNIQGVRSYRRYLRRTGH